MQTLSVHPNPNIEPVAFKVGDLVEVSPLLCKSESLGYIYVQYTDEEQPLYSKIRVLLKDGRDLGPFSFADQRLYLNYVACSGFYYQFKSFGQLMADYAAGNFDKAFGITY